jgi:gamma-glutamyltranspeptidase/glutathione hydrolase
VNCFRKFSPPLLLARIVALLLIAALGAPAVLQANTFYSAKNMAVTVHPIATEAALAAFQRGGNAVDAAIAAALMLGVVDGHNSGIGGGCFLLIRFPNGKFVAIDGREMAPAAASRDMYVRNGKADPNLSQTGALAPAVPGALAAYAYAAKSFGKRPLSEPLLAAADVADTGFLIDSVYARKLAATADDLAKFPASKAIFLKRDGTPYREREILKQRDLAKSYRAIAKDGIKWFYNGPYSQAVAKWMKENGGILTAEDFLNYKLEQREPLQTTYRGYQVTGFPPPSSGGIHVAQILNMLETQNLAELGQGSPDMIHFTTEAMKLAFADRAYWLGDPAFVPVPRNLLSKDYARQLAAKIDPKHTTEVKGHGTPERAHDEVFGRHTTHLCTADAAGYWVSLTMTINTAFGSKVVVPGTGIVLNNEMDDFSIQPGVRNAFGLVGAEANAIAPGKRPLSSMSPTIVSKDGKPLIAIGGAGGPTIITQTLLSLVNLIDYRMDPEDALGYPRFHHQWSPDELRIETKFDAATLEELKRRGHTLSEKGAFGVCNVITLSRDGSQFVGANDPRVPGKAKGLE